jgi:hypothetical protein
LIAHPVEEQPVLAVPSQVVLGGIGERFDDEAVHALEKAAANPVTETMTRSLALSAIDHFQDH